MKKFLLICLSCLTIFTAVGCRKKENINTLSQNLTCYEISIALDTDTLLCTATQSIDYINDTDQILKILKLHLYPQFFEEGATHMVVSNTKLNNAYPNGMSYANFNINRVCVDREDQSIVFEGEYDDILSIDLRHSLLPNDRVCINIEYEFTLPNCEHRFGYGDNTINLANFYPIMCVYDSDGFNTKGYHPNGDPFYSDMANYLVDITLNDQYVVAGSGDKSVEFLDNNMKKVQFNARMMRDFAMVISEDFEIIEKSHNKTTIFYYYYNDEDPESNLKASLDAVRTFSNLFGDYPYSTLSVVKNDFVHGGMEYPGLVMISDKITDSNDYINVIVHEIAHQWWYGAVGNDEYLYPWLDEAITEYSTLLFYDHNDYEYTHEMMLDANKSNYTLFITVYEDVLGSIDTSMRAVDQYSTEPEYTYCTYVKGVLMYESLYQLIGEKAFIKGLQTYFNENKYTNATPEDLIDAFETASKKDLENFFSSWILGKVVIR
ncbi:MAG: M1 family metallopeptidase [Clostridia bacterium]|nr:M1 family metallopeptidase [Clostridia bacterium]